MSPFAVANGLVVYIWANCQCYVFSLSFKSIRELYTIFVNSVLGQ